jgi:hypothetical protein
MRSPIFPRAQLQQSFRFFAQSRSQFCLELTRPFQSITHLRRFQFDR